MKKVLVFRIGGRGAFHRRIMEMGFIKGNKVVVIKNTLLKDLIEYSILGYHLFSSHTKSKTLLCSGCD